MKNIFKKLMIIALTLVGISSQIEAGFFSRRSYYSYEPAVFYATPRFYYSSPERVYYYDPCSYKTCKRCDWC